jgi:ABC-type multidrug transport system ATPase subunit
VGEIIPGRGQGRADAEARQEGVEKIARQDRAIPAALATYNLELSEDGHAVIYDYDTKGDRTGITSLLNDLRNAGIRISDLDTRQSSLEDIFVSLVRAP